MQVDLGLSEFLPPLEQSLDLEFCLDQETPDFSHFSFSLLPPSCSPSYQSSSSSLLPHHSNMLDLSSSSSLSHLPEEEEGMFNF